MLLWSSTVGVGALTKFEASLAVPSLMAFSISFFVTRPSNPVPTTCDKSISFSDASLNTTGEKRPLLFGLVESC